MDRLEYYMELILPKLGPFMASQSNFDRMLEITQLFPVNISRNIVIEGRLGNVSRNSDISICLEQSERTISHVWFQANQPAGINWDSASYNNIMYFIGKWDEIGSEINKHVTSIWLEFDLDGDPKIKLSPGIFIGSDDFPSPDQIDMIRTNWLFTTALPILTKTCLNYNEKFLMNCITHLPTGAHLFQIGLFPGRQNSSLRLCISDIPPNEIIPYLVSIGYTRNLDNLKEIIEVLAPLGDIALDFDIEDEIKPVIGLEFSQKVHPGAGLVEKEIPLIKYLVEKNWCTATKGKALLTFPEIHLLPGTTLKTAENMVSNNTNANDLKNSLNQDVMHIKLVYQPEKPIEVKAYLQAVQSWLRPIDFVKRNLYIKSRERYLESLLPFETTNHTN